MAVLGECSRGMMGMDWYHQIYCHRCYAGISMLIISLLLTNLESYAEIRQLINRHRTETVSRCMLAEILKGRADSL